MLTCKPRGSSSLIKLDIGSTKHRNDLFDRSTDVQALTVLLGSAVALSAFSLDSPATSPEPPEALSIPSTGDTGVRGGELTGTVIDEVGEPLAGVHVDAWTWAPGNETTTDDQGRFSLTGCGDAERIQVRFTRAGFSPRIFLDVEAGTTDLVVRMNNDTYVEGRGVTAMGDPVSHALVRANQGPKRFGHTNLRNIWTETTSDEQGHLRLYLEPDTYDIRARAESAGVASIDGVLLQHGDAWRIDLELGQAVQLVAHFRVSETGAPVAGVRLTARQRPTIYGVSDQSGVMRINNVPLDEYRFDFASDDYARWWTDDAPGDVGKRRLREDGWQRNFDPLRIKADIGMTPITFALEQAVTISGHVVSLEGRPVEGATVAVDGGSKRRR